MLKTVRGWYAEESAAGKLCKGNGQKAANAGKSPYGEEKQGFSERAGGGYGKFRKGATTLKGYKGMTKEMTCRGMKFEVGKTYRVDGEIKICQNGLHFCTNLSDVFKYYGTDDSRFFKVETKQPVFSEGDKSVTSELTIVREISNVELSRCKYGNGNGNGYGNGNGNGNGYGYGYGDGYGNGYGDGSGYGYGDGYGDGYGTQNIQKILLYKE